MNEYYEHYSGDISFSELVNCNYLKKLIALIVLTDNIKGQFLSHTFTLNLFWPLAKEDFKK